MIYKSKQTEKFTVLPNVIFEELNDGLAIGILAYLLSKPSDWVTYKNQIHDHFSEGRDRINKSFKLLQDKGFIVGIKKVDSTGKFTGYEWIVYNEPIINSDENRNTENRLTENRNTETCQLLNKDYTKERNNKDIILPKNKFSEDVYKVFEHTVLLFKEAYRPVTESQKNNWLDCIEKLNRIDGLDFREIYKIAKWGLQDDFWGKNFYTILKLRKKNREGIEYWKVFSQLNKTPKKSNVLFVTPEGVEITDPHVLYTYQQTGKV